MVCLQWDRLVIFLVVLSRFGEALFQSAKVGLGAKQRAEP